MKKLLITLFLITTIPLTAAVWNPAIEAGIGYRASFVAEDDRLWSSLNLYAVADAAAVKLGERHTLSFPLMLSFTSESSENDRLTLPYTAGGTLSIRYGFKFTERIEASLSSGASLIFHLRQRAVSWGFNASASLSIAINRYLAVTIPIRYELRRALSSFSLSAGIKYIPGGF
ncbi:MAG: hypothetical protein IAA97_03810 [Spirochaetes bacterium]|uniref:Outer membrane protein beta-barrel domain-containing protein n=1 Tax=Candidatus Ornithospirochaeta stercoripullorum TaxID=2840899 RepID=A0A9D9H202_9SPIO|nr:hypothetical protein [Candidatus Ornithospirochaeta stercoripullorum]